ncbi:hypothetical protein ATX28_03500 [Oenococcus oeni]|uniref:hypothetical protein n=1 Tax=Oenococcus oeni TaxID=1247 RepID=UPI0009532734|nr:hypothetical protein [Oenococcus oeni]OLQ40701.1 hypothetical protein ATX28_03500 [Oenococcus oeni]
MNINKNEYKILNKLYKTKKAINIERSDTLDSLVKRNLVSVIGTEEKFILDAGGKKALKEYLANKCSSYVRIYNSVLSLSAPLKPLNHNY